jgi:hypothetical protein
MKEEKFLDKIEKQAWDVVSHFKTHPIKSILTAILVIWFIKKIVNWIKEV